MNIEVEEMVRENPRLAEAVALIDRLDSARERADFEISEFHLDDETIRDLLDADESVVEYQESLRPGMEEAIRNYEDARTLVKSSSLARALIHERGWSHLYRLPG